MDVYNLVLSEMMHKKRQDESDARLRERTTARLLVDPGKMDSLVASITANLSPTGKKPKLSSFSSKTEAYDSLIPADHPFKGFGGELKEKLTAVMSDPRTKGMEPLDIVNAVTEKALNAPGRFGISKVEEAMEYKRRADAAWFGIGGEDEDVRKPLGSDYDKWLKTRRFSEDPINQMRMLREAASKETDPDKKAEFLAEANRVEHEASPIATPGGLALMTGIGAAHGAFVAGPAGAAVGAVAGAGMEVFGKPISKAIQQTEWYKSIAGPLTRSRSSLTAGEIITHGGVGGLIGSKYGLPGILGGTAAGVFTATDTGKALLAELAPYMASDLAFSKAFMATFTVPKAVAKSIAANPSAANIVEAGAVLKGSRKIMEGDSYIAKVVNRLANPPKEIEFGFNTDVYEAFRQIGNSATGKVRLSKYYVKASKEAYEKWGADLMLNSHGENTLANFQKISSEAFDVISTDPEALKVAMSHPDGIVKGAIQAAEETKLLAYDPTKMAKEIDNSVFEAEAKAKTARMRVAKVGEQSYFDYVGEQAIAKEAGMQTGMSKDYYTPKSPADKVDWVKMADEDLKAAPKDVPIVTVGQAKVVDALAEGTGKAPAEVHAQISKAMNSYEAPAIKDIFKLTAKPVQRDIFTPTLDSANTAIAEAENIVKRQKPTVVEEALKPEPHAPSEMPTPKEIEVKVLGEDGAEIFDKKTGKAKVTKRYQIDLGNGRLLVNQKPDVEVPHFKTKAQAEAAYKKYAEQATEEELAEKAVLADKDIGTKTRVGKAFKEVIDTELGPMEISYSATKTATTTEARQIAVDEMHKLVSTKVAEVESIARMKALMTMSEQELNATIKEHIKAYDAGKIGAEETLKFMEDATEAAEVSWERKFAQQEGLVEWAISNQPIVNALRKIVGNKVFGAVFGVPAAAYTFFNNQDEAHAGMLSTFAESAVKGLSKAKNIPKAMQVFLGELKAARYITDATLAEGKSILNYNDFQVGLKGSEFGGANKIIENIKGWYEKAPKGSYMPVRYRLMSPHMIFDEVVSQGKWLMNNPGVFKASWQAAEYVNNIKANTIIDRMVEAANIPSAKKAVTDAFAELVPTMEKQVEFEFRSNEVKKLTGQIKNISEGAKRYRKLTPDMRNSMLSTSQKELAEHETALANMGNPTEVFHKRWEEIAAPLAKEHSGVRTFLAIGDNANFDKYPFLKNITFTKEEKLAIGKAKEQLLVYKKRLEELGEKVIEGDYAPHIFHPNFKANRLIELSGSGDKASVYMQIYKRSLNSRPMIPDFETSLRSYVGDVERRIHQIGFWKKEGWDEIMARTEHIPVVNYAFRSLKDGMRPVEQTFGNKLAQKYIEFEAVHKLFLSPSATLKHLIKATADMAQLGTAETAEALPLATRMTMARTAQGNPTIAKKLASLGVTSKRAQDQLVLDYFKSLVPAYGARRYILDLGLAPMDEMFVRARGLWGKVQDISGSGINLAELTDRGLTLVLGEQVAAKQGLTIEQALYGTFDMLLKNNFMSRELNPAWLNRPKIKMMAMFQATPFKIFERRMVNFLRSGKVVKDLGKEIFNLTKADHSAGNFNNTRKVLKDLRDLRYLVKQGEHSLKGNLFVDAALKEADFYGNPVINTFARDVLIVGAASYGFGSAGLNLKHHFFHIPFLKPGAVDPTLSFNPALGAIQRGMNAWENREEGDDEFLTTKIYQRWLGKGWTGLLPTPAQKIVRITENDIPAIYKNSPYRYLLAVPSVKK